MQNIQIFLSHNQSLRILTHAAIVGCLPLSSGRGALDPWIGRRHRHDRRYNYTHAPISRTHAPTDNLNLYVSGLPFHFTDAQLAELFTPYGKVVSARMLSNQAETQHGRKESQSHPRLVGTHNKPDSYVGVTLRKPPSKQQVSPRLVDNVGFGLVLMGSVDAAMWAIKAKNKKDCPSCKCLLYVKIAANQKPQLNSKPVP